MSYKTEQLNRAREWSRVRGGSAEPVLIILHKSGNYGKSNIFGRCKFCHSGLTVFGVCVTCEYCEVCCTCKKVIQPDKRAIPMIYNHKKVNYGHYCLKCGEKI